MKIIILIIIALCLLALFLYWSDKALVLTKYSYKNKKIKKAITITQVSDLQSSRFGEGQKNIVDVVKKSEPDVIVFTGDLMDRNKTDYDASLMCMRELVKIAPVFYVNGNHELALPEADTSKLYDKLRDMGVHVLFDRTEEFTACNGQTINFIGVSEYTIYGNKFEPDGLTRKALDDVTFLADKVEELAKEVNEEDLNILLIHEPQYFRVYDNENVDLVFAGHAHGGQIRLPFTEGLFAPGQGILPKLTSGVHKGKWSTMIISRGLGNSTFPFRIFNRPEIVTVVLGEEQV